ncbi:MAG: RraA family protein [Candidatus Binataceae bacterium]|nr:RraA family protein [Candidatus Binataceae bacterium]
MPGNARKPTDMKRTRGVNSVMRRLARFSTATLVESLRDYSAALPSAIKPVASRMKLCGPAVTVSSPPGDNLMLHRAIYAAQPGDILVIEVSGQHEFGYWGDVMTQAARVRKLGGMVIDGCIRDAAEIARSGFPIFARGICIRGTGKRGGGAINHPIVIGDSSLQPGDFVIGDRDGVVVVPFGMIEDVISKAAARVKHELEMKKALAKGRSTLEIHGWSA